MAKEVWTNWCHVNLLDNVLHLSFPEVFLWIKEKVDPIELRNFITLAWASWTCRNKAIFEDENFDAVSIAKGMLDFVDGWMDYNARVIPPRTREALSLSCNSWSKPEAGVVKINVDVHMSDDGFMGLGAMGRNCDGGIEFAAVQTVRGGWGVEVGEALGVLFGAQMARCLGFSNIVIETDSLSLFKKLDGRSEGRTSLFLFISDILSFSDNFISYAFSHVKRGENCVAHFVAREVTEIGTDRIWLPPIPQPVCNIADIDLI